MKRIQLEDLSKKPPFQVPDGYFYRLTVDIQARIQDNKKAAWLPAPQLKWAFAAAVMLTVVALIWIYQHDTNHLTAEQMLAQIEEQALLDYLDLNDFSETDLLDGVQSADMNELWQETNALDELNLDTEDVDQLLLEYENDINS